jgi:hypothetical protein
MLVTCYVKSGPDRLDVFWLSITSDHARASTTKNDVRQCRSLLMQVNLFKRHLEKIGCLAESQPANASGSVQETS